MTDVYSLHRFLDAQARVYDTVLDELRAGRKSSHWIWFTFPQIIGLGHSGMAQKFAIASLDEAKTYLQHPVLGPRLRACTQLVLNVNGRSAEEIFSFPDNLKFRSCLGTEKRGHSEFPNALRDSSSIDTRVMDTYLSLQ